MKFAGKWMELENNILSEVTQTQKNKQDKLGYLFSGLFLSSLLKLSASEVRMLLGSFGYFFNAPLSEEARFSSQITNISPQITDFNLRKRVG
ncbi:hypothetical protein STEG23_005032 [Scotinomys teguina]